MNKLKYDNAIKEKVIILYQNGSSLEQISKIVQLSCQTISNILKRNNVVTRKIRVYSEKEENDVIKMYIDQGHSSVYIANYFNTSPSMILKILGRNNIQRRRCTSNLHISKNQQYQLPVPKGTGL